MNWIWIAVCALCKSGHLQSKLDDEVQDMTAKVHLRGKLSLITQIKYNTSSGELFLSSSACTWVQEWTSTWPCADMPHINPHLLTLKCPLWLRRKSVRLPPASAPWKENSLILGWGGQKCELSVSCQSCWLYERPRQQPNPNNENVLSGPNKLLMCRECLPPYSA